MEKAGFSAAGASCLFGPVVCRARLEASSGFDFRLEAGKGLSVVLDHKKQVQAAEESRNAAIPLTDVEASSSGHP